MRARDKAELKLLASLEKAVVDGSKKMTAKQFQKATSSTHRLAQDVIARHRALMEVWSAMDKHIQAVARRINRVK